MSLKAKLIPSPCKAIRIRGKRCGRPALPHGNFCWQHERSAPDHCSVSLNGRKQRWGRKGFFDVTGAPFVEIRIRHDGKVVWIHTGKVPRSCRAKR